MRTWAALKDCWNMFAGFCDWLGDLGEEFVFVKPDMRPRYHTPCRCSSCGVTQLVGGPAENNRWVFANRRDCIACGAPVSVLEDFVGQTEVVMP